MKKRSGCPERTVLAVFTILFCTGHVFAQWVTETHALEVGWNSVFLRVNPANDRADSVFGGTSEIERVWTWRVTAPQSADDPASAGAEWLVWLPASDPNSIVNNLVGVDGGQVYLIKASAPATFTVTGIPNADKTDWLAGSNVAGLYVDPASPSSFANYFAPSSPHSSSSIFTLNTNGSLSSVSSSANATAGTGYWISASAATTYSGPVDINTSALRGLDYEKTLVELQLSMRNLDPNAIRNVTLSVSGSATVPSDPNDLPSDAGVIPLQIRQFTTDPNQIYQLLAFDTSNPRAFSLGNATLPQQATRILQISVKRQGQTAAVLATDGTGTQYQSVVKINDGAGFERLIPVTAEVPSQAGLYAGQVTVNQVAWIQADARIVTDRGDPNTNAYEDATIVDSVEGAGADTTTPRPTQAAFSFPVIMHFDGTNYTFLSSVTLLREPDPNDPTEPGRFVLATPSCTNCDSLEPGSNVDGQLFKRRISAANFSFINDLTMTGIGFGGSLSVPTLTIGENDPLNPFLHRYHPDHDGDRPGEVLTVTRDITFDFTCAPSTGQFDRPGQGDAFLSGCYSETLSGLHKRNINVAGTFELRRISAIATLNDVSVQAVAAQAATVGQ